MTAYIHHGDPSAYIKSGHQWATAVDAVLCCPESLSESKLSFPQLPGVLAAGCWLLTAVPPALLAWSVQDAKAQI